MLNKISEKKAITVFFLIFEFIGFFSMKVFFNLFFIKFNFKVLKLLK
jgi:hypothetical protein